MINKSESTTSNAAVASVDTSSSNTQGAMGGIIDVSNILDTPMATLPLEMIHYIGSFLSVKDKVVFNQMLEDSGLCASLNYTEILQEFKKLGFTQKIEVLLESKNKDYDFSKFYTLKVRSEEELVDLFSLLFNEVSDDFRKRKELSEEIATLVEAIENTAFVERAAGNGIEREMIDMQVIDPHRIKYYVDRRDPNDAKDTDELIHYLFPNLAMGSEIRKEIAHRIDLFDSRAICFSRNHAPSSGNVTRFLLAFLKMKQEHRGFPIEIVVPKQKLPDSHLIPILQKAKEKMLALPTEGLRALLIMAAGRSQRDYFCDKMIEIGAEDNPFYLPKSPYFHLLKADFTRRINVNHPENCHDLVKNNWNSSVFKYHVAYNASDADLREYAATLCDQFSREQEQASLTFANQFLGIQGDPPTPHSLFIQRFYDEMENKHNRDELWNKEYRERRALMETSTPDPVGLAKNSPQYVVSSVAKDMSPFSMWQFLEDDPDNINAQDSNGNTLLHIFIKRGDIRRVANLAKEYKFDLNIKNNEGTTPLMLLVELDDMPMLNFLLGIKETLNFDINQRDNDGNTALHYAILLNKKLVMYRLLSHKETDLSIVNNAGQTPYDLAESAGLSSMFHSLNL